MGRQILSFGVAATHGRITALSGFADVVSMSNFDAFVFDPHVLRVPGLDPQILLRRQAEIRDLVLRKGGLLLCILRPPCQMQTNSGARLDVLNLFDLVHGPALGLVKMALRLGTATKWSVTKGVKGVANSYLQALAGKLRSEAFFGSRGGEP